MKSVVRRSENRQVRRYLLLPDLLRKLMPLLLLFSAGWLQAQEVPPMQGQEVPPMQGQEVPPMQGQEVPPMQAQEVPLMQAQEVPLMQAQEVPPMQTGVFALTRTLNEVLGEATAGNLSAIHPPEKPVSWEVYVPPDYDPTKPPGLLVYISPTQNGRVPERWDRVLAEHNLIWVAANKSGNQVAVQKRALFAVIAPTLIEQGYTIDRQRLYISGMSGGGKMASMVATDHAHLFKGAIFNCGVEFWDAKPRRIDDVLVNRYVFVTGEYDQALRPTKRVYGRYKKAGVTQVKLMVIDDMGHGNPPPREFEEAIEFLDG